ncbi:amino acid racemase [Variovorax sp. PCZ-1]|uniref:aspartate/glutamate racemase family protein n=1 Tax=Variovorax sp. PCZ-1 TaxID=2835533 RepID=UPI001BCC69DB|nr:amino acid racemase [Variovorax sp. PCZ-1]MBS7809212.1 aspartate/glutamate racemase family protein [Variovorax sp. PCZ-1]
MNTVGILGGMGPAAGADFVRLFVRACAEHLRTHGQPVRDQSFPEHWLAQVPVPDRTRALQDTEPGAHQPLDPMLQALGRLAALGARSVAIACNTAHAWHTSLQSRFPQIELLHMADEVAALLQTQGVRAASLMATEGSYRTGLYEAALRKHGITCYMPNTAQRKLIMQGIFDGVKADDYALAAQCFGEVASDLARQYTDATIIMGCTEIPLGLQGTTAVQSLKLMDPAQVLATSLAARAYAEVT